MTESSVSAVFIFIKSKRSKRVQVTQNKKRKEKEGLNLFKKEEERTTHHSNGSYRATKGEGGYKVDIEIKTNRQRHWRASTFIFI